MTIVRCTSSSAVARASPPRSRKASSTRCATPSAAERAPPARRFIAPALWVENSKPQTVRQQQNIHTGKVDMAVVRWNPWSDLSDLHTQMDQLFHAASPATASRNGVDYSSLPVDIRQTDAAFFVE